MMQIASVLALKGIIFIFIICYFDAKLHDFRQRQ